MLWTAFWVVPSALESAQVQVLILFLVVSLVVFFPPALRFARRPVLGTTCILQRLSHLLGRLWALGWILF